MDSDNGDDWGVQVGGPPIEEILDNRHNNPNAEKTLYYMQKTYEKLYGKL